LKIANDLDIKYLAWWC